MDVMNNVVLTRKTVKKMIRALDSIGSLISDDDLMSITFHPNTIVVESDDVVTMIKLESQ